MLNNAATLPARGPGTYHHHDALGNVVALTNAASCAVLETYTYDPFGKRTVYNATGQQIPDTAYANTHGYTGREHLPLHGLMDYRNRSYSTTLGRFLQTDPIRFRAGDVNLYRYVGNNVLSCVDSYGLRRRKPCCGGNPFNPVNQCCVRGSIFNKYPYWQNKGFPSLWECVKSCTADVTGAGSIPASIAIGIGVSGGPAWAGGAYIPGAAIGCLITCSALECEAF